MKRARAGIENRRPRGPRRGLLELRTRAMAIESQLETWEPTGLAAAKLTAIATQADEFKRRSKCPDAGPFILEIYLAAYAVIHTTFITIYQVR